MWPFKWKLLSSTFLWYCLLCCARCGSNFWVCGWNPLNESYWAALCCNTFVYALQDGSDFRVLRENPWVWPFIWKLPNSTFLWRYILKHRVNLKQHYPCNIAPLTNCPVSQDLLSNFSHEIPTFLRCLYVCLSTPFVGDLCYHLSWYIAWDLVTPLAYGKYNIYNSTLCFMFLLSTSARFLKCWEFWTSMSRAFWLGSCAVFLYYRLICYGSSSSDTVG